MNEIDVFMYILETKLTPWFLDMPGYTHLKWLNKFVTPMDTLMHPKKQLPNSAGSWDEAHSLSGIILGMPKNASWNPFKITK